MVLQAIYRHGYDSDYRVIILSIKPIDNYMVLFTTKGEQLAATDAYWDEKYHTMIFHCPENF